MKYLKLKYEDARLILTARNNLLGSNRFFHPITKMHVYNSICVLFDRTPKPQLRETDDKYMPMYNDILDVVSNGYIKVNLTFEGDNITTIKTFSNSNTTTSFQYTWVDCKYVTGTLFPIFLYFISDILNRDVERVEDKSFDEIIFELQGMGVKSEDDTITYSDDRMNTLLTWCKTNSCTPIYNYLTNKQEGNRPTGFGKKVYRGIVKSNNYSGLIYIPLTDKLYDELITHTKGYSNILDGGLVTIMDYCEIYEDDVEGFVKINELNSVRKYSSFNGKIDWYKTIYKGVDVNNLEVSIKKIIGECVLILNNIKKRMMR